MHERVQTPKKQSKKKQQTAFRLPPELLERLDRFCVTRRLPTTRTAVVHVALAEFLDREEKAPS